MELNTEILQLGTLGFVFALAIREFFSWQKSRKNNLIDNKDILNELKLMNNNHLNTICHTIGSGDKEIVKAINDMNINIANKLDTMSDNISRLIGRSDK